MNYQNIELESWDSPDWVPGTVIMRDQTRESGKLVLVPHPSSDPNDPLNWSKLRKAVNYILVCYFTLMTFILVDIGTVAWGPVSVELGITFKDLNNSLASNLAGLGFGCIFAIPLAYRFGRRPVYLGCILVQLAGALWQAKTQNAGDIIWSNLICGLGGAALEAIVQLTIYDLFFVHQRGLMNGIYNLVVSIGAFLSLIPAGYIVESQGWRWIWWWTLILTAAGGLAFVFFFEESKYVKCEVGLNPTATNNSQNEDNKSEKAIFDKQSPTETITTSETSGRQYEIKPISQRLALWTYSETPFISHVILPIKLFFMLPAVAYSSLAYGTLLSWFSIVISTQSTYLLYDPYNFPASSVGLFNVSTFIGTLIGIALGGPLSDWWIVFMAGRNKGIYEPEFRLWLAIPGILLIPGGERMDYSSRWSSDIWCGIRHVSHGHTVVFDGLLSRREKPYFPLFRFDDYFS
ncbi:hypothetical protein G7Z17_g3545 [Cylindrodendrum hubeiense]|uniref:Major facilitator superfamily (MFS) profile domain-containing protein n=1 Tax=Cylindrodendrum hubeiense TaxID=595255 RepID=A0A9P5HFM3_9HYPO|nr:hypothetical protein G7Z17_g3545 [Cylindrodendrum hubeiense]